MRLPNDGHRLAIYGKTGTGKTLAGLWHLQQRNFVTKRWEVLDFKGDTSIAKIPRLEELGIYEGVGKHPGLYVRRPLPGQEDAVEQYLWKLWERRNTGLFIDEGYAIDRNSNALKALLTQGRSLRIPMISCTQRPAWVSPFLMSEADFHQVFYLNNPRDVEKIQEWIPGTGPLRQDYHSYYYDATKDRLDYLRPVPPETEIIDRFHSKMPVRFHLFKGITSNAVKKRQSLATP